MGGSSGSTVTMIQLTTGTQGTVVLQLSGPSTALDQMIRMVMSGKTGRMVTMEEEVGLGMSAEEPLVDPSLMFTKLEESFKITKIK